ncbi:hypothetical protein [Pannonibacter phragmitetus]|uniref:hypothetical protein n=1 Tax=Pannonibacter phragmitetus TaxID=121719 RepID=UPI003D2EE8EB
MEETEVTEKMAELSYKIKGMTLCCLLAGLGGKMGMTRDWATYGHWHELLDGLCTEQGYPDNMALADALCAASGNRTQAAFDTAVKNLRNWRHGVHIPQRKNFILLGKILKVDRDEALRQVWSRLYSQAKVKPGDTDIAGADATNEPVRKARKSRWPFMVGGVIVAGALAATALVLPSNPSDEVADPVASYEGIVAEYVRHVSIKVGDLGHHPRRARQRM